MKSVKPIVSILVVSLVAVLPIGCGSSTTTISTRTTPTASFVGTQSPGDYWSWTETTDDNGLVSFTASNNTQGVTYSGSATPLTGGSSGFSKLTVTSSNDPDVITPVYAYELEIPNTMIMAAVPPFYTFNQSGEVQASIHGPVVAAAQGSCPTSGTTTVNWIVMPSDNWCPALGSDIATGTCPAADYAFGTAVITVSDGAYTVTVTPYHLNDTSPDPQFSLSSCTCSEGVIECMDPNSHPVRIAFTPSGVFIEDTVGNGVVGVVQPDSNIDLNDFLANGNSFKGIIFDSWEDYYNPCTSDSQCVDQNGISGGKCLDAYGTGYCGVPETKPVSITADGTELNARSYSSLDTGALNTEVSTVDFSSAVQLAPGLIIANLTPACTGGTTFPIAMVVTQIDNKYVAFTLSHSTCPTFDTAFNVLAVQQ
jgi:hypothetical protein